LLAAPAKRFLQGPSTDNNKYPSRDADLPLDRVAARPANGRAFEFLSCLVLSLIPGTLFTAPLLRFQKQTLIVTVGDLANRLRSVLCLIAEDTYLTRLLYHNCAPSLWWLGAAPVPYPHHPFQLHISSRVIPCGLVTSLHISDLLT
jgi:hypothetical protein